MLCWSFQFWLLLGFPCLVCHVRCVTIFCIVVVVGFTCFVFQWILLAIAINFTTRILVRQEVYSLSYWARMCACISYLVLVRTPCEMYWKCILNFCILHAWYKEREVHCHKLQDMTEALADTSSSVHQKTILTAFFFLAPETADKSAKDYAIQKKSLKTVLTSLTRSNSSYKFFWLQHALSVHFTRIEYFHFRFRFHHSWFYHYPEIGLCHACNQWLVQNWYCWIGTTKNKKSLNSHQTLLSARGVWFGHEIIADWAWSSRDVWQWAAIPNLCKQWVATSCKLQHGYQECGYPS